MPKEIYGFGSFGTQTCKILKKSLYISVFSKLKDITRVKSPKQVYVNIIYSDWSIKWKVQGNKLKKHI